MNQITNDDLLTTYKVLGELAEMYDLTMDNSFIRTRNKVANEMMNRLIKQREEENNG